MAHAPADSARSRSSEKVGAPPLARPTRRRDRDRDQHDRALVGDHHRHLAREADRAVRRARGRACDHQRDARNGEQIDEDDQVAGHRRGRVDAGDRDEHDGDEHRGRADERRAEEHRLAGLRRRHHALEAELDEIEDRLRQRRPDAALQARGETPVGALERQPEGERERPAGEDQRGDQNRERVGHDRLPQTFSPSAALSGANSARRRTASGVS